MQLEYDFLLPDYKLINALERKKLKKYSVKERVNL